MKTLLVIFLIMFQASTLLADAPKYLILFNSGNQSVCYIINNDSVSKRLEIQYENSVQKVWVSYFQIKAIIDPISNRDVTDQFILSSTIDTSPRQQIKREMSSGEIIFISIAGTIMALLVLGALASK